MNTAFFILPIVLLVVFAIAFEWDRLTEKDLYFQTTYNDFIQIVEHDILLNGFSFVEIIRNAEWNITEALVIPREVWNKK